jgi:hypothetical protein
MVSSSMFSFPLNLGNETRFLVSIITDAFEHCFVPQAPNNPPKALGPETMSNALKYYYRSLPDKSTLVILILVKTRGTILNVALEIGRFRVVCFRDPLALTNAPRDKASKPTSGPLFPHRFT